MNAANITEWGGFLIITLLVFSETGLLVGLAVPGGETLVFTAGLLAGTGSLGVPVLVLLACLILASVAGDISGYYIGRRFGRRLYEKEDTWYFKKKYLILVENFFKKHKKASLILGKFLPVIRPFSPVISGTTNLKFSGFISLSAVASVLYISAFVLAGYFLGNQFPALKDYLGWILPLSITVAFIPIVSQILKHRKGAA